MSEIPAVEALLARRRFRPIEALPWVLAAAVYFLLPQYLQFGSQVIGMMLLALSFDLLLGYAGIVTLGHAAYYGFGAYTAGLLAKYGWGEPLTGLLAAGVAAGLLGVITGAVILRTRGLALLMLGMAVALMLNEAGNHMNSITGGADGLQGVDVWPIFGRFDFDIYGRTAYLYSLAVLFLAWLLMRQLVNAPFGRSLTGIRQNPMRMRAIGVPVWGRQLVAFTISTALAGIAGGLSAETNQFASLSKDQPVFWVFWVGLLLIALVLFNRGGVLGLLDLLRARLIGRGRTG